MDHHDQVYTKLKKTKGKSNFWEISLDSNLIPKKNYSAIPSMIRYRKVYKNLNIMNIYKLKPSFKESQIKKT